MEKITVGELRARDVFARVEITVDGKAVTGVLTEFWVNTRSRYLTLGFAQQIVHVVLVKVRTDDDVSIEIKNPSLDYLLQIDRGDS